jgi:tetratricopeptide (TPR) repeat protein
VARRFLPRAAALLAPLHPAADLPQALATQVYQAILERQPAPMIGRLKEILAKPDPALGYMNGGLRFDLGWAQEVAGDHAAAQETWRQARSELESFLKEQPENEILLRNLALTNKGLGDKAAALAMTERAMAANPIEKDRWMALLQSRSLPGYPRKWESSTAPSPLYRNYSRSHTRAHSVKRRLLPRCSGSIQCSIHSGTIRASKSSARKKSREPLFVPTSAPSESNEGRGPQ